MNEVNIYDMVDRLVAHIPDTEGFKVEGLWNGSSLVQPLRDSTITSGFTWPYPIRMVLLLY